MYFRASTCREAERLDLQGRAVNLPDGSVEVVARGSAASQAALEAWLHRGPPMARVTDVTVETVDEEVGDGFTTG